MRPSGRTSSSGLGSGEPGAAWTVPPAAEAARAPRSESAGLAARLVDWTCSCGGACGGDAPGTAPGRWPGTAPVLPGAALNLSSCVHFLVHSYFLMRCYGFQRSLPGADFPLACRQLQWDPEPAAGDPVMLAVRIAFLFNMPSRIVTRQRAIRSSSQQT